MTTKDALKIASALRSDPSPSIVLMAAEMLELMVKRERDAQDIMHRRQARPEPGDDK